MSARRRARLAVAMAEDLSHGSGEDKRPGKKLRRSMDLDEFFKREFAEHEAVMRATLAHCEAPFRALADRAAAAIGAGGKLLFFGNGGSAADAQHLATELAVRYVKDRVPI